MPLRVLWVIKGLGPGGAEQLLVSLARAHDPTVVELEVAYVLGWKDHLVASLRDAGVVVHALGVERGTDARWVPRLARLIHRRRPDVVHAHSPLVAAAIRPLVRTGITGRPRPALVTTEHNAWPTFAWPTRVVNALTAPLDDATLAVSSEVARSLRPASLRVRSQVVVHGIDLAAAERARAHRQRTRTELGASPDEVLVVTVANHRRQKSYPDLLAAARSVLDRGLPVRFVAVGQGPETAAIEAVHAQLRLGDRFRLLGYRTDVLQILAAGDVFALASAFEGLPVAVMEALAAGLPVVATAVGGIPDAVEDGREGRLVPPGRPRLLADALVDVVGDAETRAALSAAARRRAHEFDINRAARTIEAAYLSVRASTRPSS